MKTLSQFTFFITVVLAASSEIASGQTVAQPGYYRLKVGDVEVTALSDGTVPVSAMDLFQEAAQPERVGHLLQKAYLQDPVEVSINTYLIKLRDKLILVDAGAGDLFGKEYGGKLVSSLSAAGYKPEQVTDVLITHVHLDHSGGLASKGLMLFPKAMIHVNKKEMDFWEKHLKPETGEKKGITSARASFLTLKLYLDKGKVKTFEGSVKLFPEISTLEFVGHTPGHTVFVLESNAQKLLFWGDLIHVADIQLSEPSLYNGFDFDKQKAASQRQFAYKDAAASGYLVAADHISFPGIGRIHGSAEGLVWFPIPYSVLGRTN